MTAISCRMCLCGETSYAGTVAGFDFVECRRCGFIFSPMITEEPAYGVGYHGPDDGAPRTGWAASIEFLEPALHALGEDKLRIFDFGTGQSIVPDILRSRGDTVHALDLAAPLRRHPHRFTGSLLELELPLRDFDLVFAFQVFEHLPNPRPILGRLLGMTRRGGFLLIHTDMETDERRKGFTNWWYVLPPDHCSFYRHRTFEVYLDGRDAEVVWKDAKRVLVKVRE